jgi:hypothetical protein
VRARAGCAAFAVGLLLNGTPAAQDPVAAAATVATHYFYWYRHPDEHFGGAGREGHLHRFVEPERVRYDSPQWHRGEFRDMAAHGIDVALPVYWGFPGCAERADLRFAVLGLPAMVEALDAMAAVGEPRPGLGLFYDTSTLWNAVRGAEPPDGRADLSAAAGRELFHATVLGFFAAVPERHWARHRGRPLVVLYTSGFAARWDAGLGAGLRSAFAERFGGERPFVVADVSWGEVGQDATTQWGAALAGPFVHGRVAQIGPGYDDSPVPGRRTPFRPREGGAFYRYSWRAAVAARAELVLIETWNEMHEGTEVCRTVETGASYLDLTREGVARLRRGEPGPEVALAFDAPRPRPDLSWGTEGAGAVELRWEPGRAFGLAPIAWEDGPVEEVDGGIRARCPDGRPVTYLYVRVSDHWRFDDEVDLVLDVRGTRNGGAPLLVEFDSRDRGATLDGAYATARPSAHSDAGYGVAGQGGVTSFVLPRARLASRQNGGADLRFVIRGGDLTVRALRLRPRAH